MTLEQEYFWNILKFDPKTMAEELGHQMQSVKIQHGANSKQFHDAVDRCFYLAMTNVKNETDLLKMVKHWLSDLGLPFDPSRMESFERFNQTYASKVASGIAGKLDELQWS